MAWKKVVTEATSGTITQSAAGLTTTLDAGTGGTGQGGGYAIGDILYATGAATLSKLAAGSSGLVLTAKGTATAPEWDTAAAGDITGVTLTGDSGTANDSTGNVNISVLGGTGCSTTATGSTLTVNTDQAHGIGDTPIFTGLDLFRGDSGVSRTIEVNASSSGAGGNLIIAAGKGASSSDNGGSIIFKACKRNAIAATALTISIEDGGITSTQNMILNSDTEGADSPTLKFITDQSDDDGDDWVMGAAASGNAFTISNDLSGSSVAQLTLTPHATPASGTAAFVGNVTVAGNFTVNGTTTTVDTTNLIVEDKMIKLANVLNPTKSTADGGGIQLETSATVDDFPEIKWTKDLGGGNTDGSGTANGLTGWSVSNMQTSAHVSLPIAVMEFSTNSTAPTGIAGGVGSFHFDSGDNELYIRTS